MEYVAPESLADACRALHGDGVHCLAGGQSLVAMMNLGLATPQRLVSLRRIPELRGIETMSDGGVRIGAMSTHAAIAELRAASAAARLLAETARVVAYPAVRTRGTIGGSAALADPAADYPVALCAINATIDLASSAGRRSVAARDFFRGMFETALAPGEIVEAVRLPGTPKRGGVAYEKLSLVAGDFAILSVGAVVADDVRIAIGGYAMKPIVLGYEGTPQDAMASIVHDLASEGDPPSDHRASTAYRRRVAPALVRRALERASRDTRS